jgi:hypothetical protein
VACEQAGATVYLPKPLTSDVNAKGRFGKQDFVCVGADDVYLCAPVNGYSPMKKTERHCGAIGPPLAVA